MTDQWRELKETITELRDNDGAGTQQEACKFLANYMDVLEKQMIDPIDRVLEIIDDEISSWERIREEVGCKPKDDNAEAALAMLRLRVDELTKSVAICCGATALADETVWMEVKSDEIQ